MTLLPNDTEPLEAFEKEVCDLMLKYAETCGANGIAYVLARNASLSAYNCEPESGMAHYLLCEAMMQGMRDLQEIKESEDD